MHHKDVSALFRGELDYDRIPLLRENLRSVSASHPSHWQLFADALAVEKWDPGQGRTALRALAGFASLGWAESFEMARILSGTVSADLADPFRKRTLAELAIRGYTRVPELAKVVLARVRDDIRADRLGEAEAGLAFAADLDPMTPWVPYLSLTLLLGGDAPWNWDMGLAWNHIQDIVGLWSYYDNQFFVLLNGAQWMRSAFSLFLFLCLLLLFIRYYPNITHHWAERLPRQVELPLRYAVIGILVGCLWIIGLGFVVLSLAGVILLWKHCGFSEKSILKVVLAALLLLPLWLAGEHALYRHLDSESGMRLYQIAFNRGSEKNLETRLADFTPRMGRDSLYLFMGRSLYYKKQGDISRARAWASAAERLAPEEPLVTLQKGNLALMEDEFVSAREFYSSATQAGAGYVETWFNMSQMELFANNSSEHKKLLDRAGMVDALRVTAFLQDNDRLFSRLPVQRRTMDVMPRPGMFWSDAYVGLKRLEILPAPVRSGLASYPPWLYYGGLGLSLLFLFIRYHNYSVHVQGRTLFGCKICGRTMCRQCRKGLHCVDCFKTVSGVSDAKLRIELTSHLKSRGQVAEVLLHHGLNAVFPGAGEVYAGKGRARFLCLFITCFLVSQLYGMTSHIMEYPDFVLGPLAWMLWLPLLALYLFFILRLLLKVSKLSVAPRLQTQEGVFA